jgi:hypothetical protein
MLTPTHLNNQYKINLITSLSLLGLLDPNHNYYRLLKDWGVTAVVDLMATILLVMRSTNAMTSPTKQPWMVGTSFLCCGLVRHLILKMV